MKTGKLLPIFWHYFKKMERRGELAASRQQPCLAENKVWENFLIFHTKTKPPFHSYRLGCRLSVCLSENATKQTQLKRLLIFLFLTTTRHSQSNTRTYLRQLCVQTDRQTNIPPSEHTGSRHRQYVPRYILHACTCLGTLYIHTNVPQVHRVPFQSIYAKEGTSKQQQSELF